MNRRETSSGREYRRRKSSKKAQESSDTSEISVDYEEDSSMHKLSGLVEAAKIVENVPNEEKAPIKKGRKTSRMAANNPSKKGIEKKQLDTDDSDTSSDESIEDIKDQIKQMLKKLEKMESKKKKSGRKRKAPRKIVKKPSESESNGKDDTEDRSEEKKQLMDSQGKEGKELGEKTSTNSDSSTTALQDNTMQMMMMFQYNQMMMQQMYLQPYAGYPTLLTGNRDFAYNPTTGAPLLMGNPKGPQSTPPIKIVAPIITSPDTTKTTPEDYVNVDIHSKKSSKKDSKHYQKSKDNDEDSDASEVYEPEQKKDIQRVQYENPTQSLLFFCDKMNNDKGPLPSAITSSVIKPVKKQGEEKADSLPSELLNNKDNFISKNEQPNMAKEGGGSVNVANALLKLIPPQVRKEMNMSSSNEENPDDSVTINGALMTMIRQTSQTDSTNPSDITEEAVKSSLLKLLSTKDGKQRTSHIIPTSSLKEFQVLETSHDLNNSKLSTENAIWLQNCTQNLYLQDQDGDTILHILIAKEDERNAISIIKKMKGYRMDILNALGQTPLHLAMYISNIKIIEALLQHGADVSIVDAHGNSPLHIACEENSLEMVHVLFDYHLSHRTKHKKIMHMKNNQGMAAIHIATLNGNEDILRILVRYKADLNVQEGRSGNTPLVMALAKGNWELSDFFIEHGADVNIPSFSNTYPLHYAVQGNKIEMVKKLLSRGAEMGSKANEYDTVQGKDTDIRVLLAKEMRKRRRKRAKEQQHQNQDSSPEM